jgi:hypothetical protein
VESREQAAAADLAAKLRSIAAKCSSRAKAAADTLPAGFGHVDDVIVLLQPLRLAAAGKDESALPSTLLQVAEKNFLTGTQAVAEGGLWAAIVGGCAARGFGFHVELTENEGVTAADALFAERSDRALVSTRPKAHLPVANFVERGGLFTAEAIGRVTAGDVRVHWMGETLLAAASLDLI